uniref:Uncharacterized protein n=1 Tax=Anguilla anguilla TaxID=7936 RepID=A0A0E9XVS9_ANGAN
MLILFLTTYIMTSYTAISEPTNSIEHCLLLFIQYSQHGLTA